ncbi:MAG: flagellar hook-associated protein FlgL [Syntrophales bacterium]|nr:flagellar hook-associated protein FlgL [Syntrophales bacterium]
MRVTENMKFSATMGGLFTIQNQYSSLLEKMATQKQVNRPSDDPVGITRILGIRTQQAAVDQYKANISTCESWITMTEAKLNSVNEILVKARELALSQATATASSETRKIAADQVKGIIEELLSLANSRLGDRYLFAGSTNVEPFSSSVMSASVGAAVSAEGNVFDGMVTSGGTYTGTQNKTYVLKVTKGGPLNDVNFVISSDGGKTWGSEQTGLDTPVSMGDGISLTFAAGTKDPAEGDIFYVRATAQGYYRGNGDRLSLTISPGVSLNYSLSGEEVFTDKGTGKVDIFRVLNDLKTSLETNNVNGISDALSGIDDALKQVSLSISRCGTIANRLDIAKSNLEELNSRLTASLSDTEDADMAELATLYSMKQVALQACYTMAGKMNETSILNYLK